MSMQGFWGTVKVPKGVRVGKRQRAALAYMAWKEGVSEESFQPAFSRWFRTMAKKHPDLFQVYVFRIYPVDEFRWLGEYNSTMTE